MVCGNGSSLARRSSLAKFEATPALSPSDDRSNELCRIGRIAQRARRWLSLARNAKAITISLCIATCLLSGSSALADKIRVVASNNAYADIARQIGGAAVTVAIADNPRDVASAIPPGGIILCGWARADAALCDAAHRAAPNATLIELPRHGADETIVINLPWYDTASTDALAQAYADRLMRMRPGLALQFAGNLARLRVGLSAISHKIGEIAKDYANSEVVAADPLSRAVAKQLGFKTTVLPVTNDPSGTISPKSAHDLEKAIEDRDGSIFLYNRDIANLETKKLVALAIRNAIPTVGLQDKLPTKLRYQEWVLRQWNTVHGALNEASP
jgi:zinc/manganese transport system substrate-binding protein